MTSDDHGSPGTSGVAATPAATPVRIPYDSSPINAQLFLASKPYARHVEDIRALRVDLVISMIWFAPPRELTKPPFTLVRLPTFDFPLLPIPLFMLRRGVEAALPVLKAGGRVLVYCKLGRHRSVAMAACILIALGMTADEAMDTIAAQRKIADPRAWYIARRIRAFEQDWLKRQAATG